MNVSYLTSAAVAVVSFVPTYSGGTTGGLHPFPSTRITKRFGRHCRTSPSGSQEDRLLTIRSW